MQHTISSRHITFEDVKQVLEPSCRLVISEEAQLKIRTCRDFLDRKVDGSGTAYYGINTGFGALYDKSVSAADLGQLQVNLMMSHACGTGEEVPAEIVKLMLFLKIQGLSYGHSGVQLETVQLLADFFNHGILPVVYEQGSLGASGDLAPLAHLCLPLIGMGEVRVGGERMPAGRALEKFGLKPVTLKSKEGLALLNGTQFMSAYGVWCILASMRLEKVADVVAALSLDAFDGRMEPFHHLIHEIRPHAGQIHTAMRFRELLKGSEMASRAKTHVQDPYAFRCIPQVHGATKDTLTHVSQVFFTEINSVTDNPTIFPAQELIISAGNFHGQPLALPMDFLAIAMAELGSISERRTYQLISGLRGLPAFLVANPGLDSGFMIPQYTAASIVSQSKQLCTPASVDSIVSSNGQEDHVSMGANAATKLRRVVCNTERILAIELMNAAQALDFRRPAKTSAGLERLMTAYRKEVAFLEKDRVLYPDMQSSVTFLQTYSFDQIIHG
ncbi:MAG: histidine ammonia-lyase [Bacteroidia bacterium]|nr:histidine ammonia-lyase [Bacteroidia bacterium]